MRFSKIPDEPGYWVRWGTWRRNRCEAIENFVVTANGIALARCPEFVYDHSDDDSVWYGPLPEPPKEQGS